MRNLFIDVYVIQQLIHFVDLDVIKRHIYFCLSTARLDVDWIKSLICRHLCSFLEKYYQRKSSNDLHLKEKSETADVMQ